MNSSTLKETEQLASLRQPWNRIWNGSAVGLPTTRFESFQNHINTFHPNGPVLALSVEQDEITQAILPLVASRSHKIFPALTLPQNPWGEAGTLLLSAEASADSTSCEPVLDRLAVELQRAAPLMLDLHWIDLTAPHWKHFLGHLVARGCRVVREPQFHVGVIELVGSWEAYFTTLSKNHRRALQRCSKRLSQAGSLVLERFTDFSDLDLEGLLRTAFEIEDSGWKGKNGSSILKTPGMFEYYLETARCLAEQGMFELQFLVANGQRIAFEYGYVAKGTYFSHKVGYRPEFAEYGPGQLLMMLQLKEFFEDPSIDRVDTMGILSESSARWCNSSYLRWRVLVSNGSRLSNSLLRLIEKAKPAVRFLLRRDATIAVPKLRPKPAIDLISANGS